MLSTIATTVQRLGHSFVNPWVYFNPTAHATSRSAASNNIVHAMSRSYPACVDV